METPFNFTQKRLAALEPGDKLYYVKDARQPGLVLAVQPTGTKAFQLYRKINGTPKRVTLGRFPELSPDDARKLAQQAAAKLAAGIDPAQEKRAARVRGITVGAAAEHYLTARTLKPATVRNYQNVLKHHLCDWLNRPLADLTREEIARHHARISEQHPPQANLTMRFLRAVYQWAHEEYLDEHGRPTITDNPVGVLSHRRQWNRESRRTDRITTAELSAWWNATAQEPPLMRDYLRLVLLTGLRQMEAASLQWSDVDLSRRTLTVRETKNGDDHTLPLSDALLDLLTARRQADPTGVYVFPGSGKSGHLEQTVKVTARITKRTGIYCTVHGLRRTFVTVAESLDFSAYALKRLLNHRTAGDVTAGYIGIDVERLREPMQRITDYILKAAGVKATAAVVSLASRQEQQRG